METQTIKQQRKTPQVNYDKLASFLKKVTPGILEALDEACGTNAFDDYNVETVENTNANACLFHKIVTTDKSSNLKKISDVSWSTGGGTLAVSHIGSQHESWCEHLSSIQLYDYTKEDSFANTPKNTLETDACVTSLAFHPFEPSIIAVGLYNGDVLLWNLREGSSVTPVNVCVHYDSVSQLSWRVTSMNETPLLVSAGKDGYVFLSELLANFTTVRSYKRLKIAKEHNPAENSRPRSAGGTQERAVESGLCITTFDFSSKDLIFFVVGTLCGGIYKCSIDRVAPIEGDRTLMDPVIDEYERHEGTITCVKFSPFRNLFVTATTEKEIRIYDFNQHMCLRSLSLEHTPVGLTWMVGNQDVFAAYGAAETISFYNVTDGKALTNIQLEQAGRGNVTSLRVNSKRDLLAIGDTLGNVEIWKIPRVLF